MTDANLDLGEVAADAAELNPLNELAFGSEELQEATEKFFEDIDLKEGSDSAVDLDTIAKNAKALGLDKKRAKGMLGEFLQSNTSKAYRKLRLKAVEGKGSIGARYKAWNKLSAEEQTEFMFSNGTGLKGNLQKGIENSTFTKAPLKAAKALKRGAKAVIPFMEASAEDWFKNQTVELVLAGVLEFKGNPSVLDQIEGEIKTSSKYAEMALKALAKYWFESEMGEKAVGMVGESARSVSFKEIREALQTEIPSHPEEDVQEETREATSETVGVPDPMDMPKAQRIMVNPNTLPKTANGKPWKPGIIHPEFAPTEPAGPGVPKWTIMGGPETPPPSVEGTI